ncbi:MAG: hypothetical protein ACOCQY_03545 [Halorhabdus sp.]
MVALLAPQDDRLAHRRGTIPVLTGVPRQSGSILTAVVSTVEVTSDGV